MNSSRLLVAVVILQGLLLIGQWTGTGPVTPAYAQIENGTGQRAQIIEEIKSLNGKVDRLVELLKSGELQVKVVGSDDKK
jgi:hypothetical protein